MLQLPALYPITDATRPEPLSAQVRRLGEAGFPLVQFRGKPLPADRQAEELKLALTESAANGGWPLICVNDRADLALLLAQEGLRPWGLHLGQEDLPATEAQRLPGLAGLHLGASTHAPAEWDQADPACDHAGVGPFRGTATKSDHASPIGLEGLRAGCAALRRQGLAPIAIGGLQLEDAPTCFQAGAESLAMVGALHQTKDLSELGWRTQLARWAVRPPVSPGRTIVILGGSGAGKSTLGRHLARRTGLSFQDLDAVIETAEGRRVAEIFAQDGEAAFRNLETHHLATLLARPCVLALGGGAWESPANRNLVAQAAADPLWLAQSPLRAWERVAGDPRRPLAQDRGAFMARWAARTPAWSLAPLAIPFGHSSEALATALVNW